MTGASVWQAVYLASILFARNFSEVASKFYKNVHIQWDYILEILIQKSDSQNCISTSYEKHNFVSVQLFIFMYSIQIEVISLTVL